jgi:UDP-2,3-diacylglucosamine hydrolase
VKIICVSDVHLSDTDSQTTAHFFHFLNTLDSSVTALYVLGDLFQYWLGDDILSKVAMDAAQHFKQLSERGITCYFAHGNRDFLLGQDYAASAHFKLLPELSVLTVHGQRFLLAHGDQFCTQDRAYQYYRRLVRQPLIQRIGLLLPRAIRQRLANFLRKRSMQAQKGKSLTDMDCVPSSMAAALTSHHCTALIHGHTHAYTVDSFEFSGIFYPRYVLGDWQEQPGNYLKLANGQVTLEKMPLISA